MKPGKLPPELLEKLVLSRLPSKGKGVIVGPGTGIDGAALRVDGTLVASSDPITGTTRRIGFYAVHVNANDVAVMGAEPRWFLTTILLPENADEGLLSEIIYEISREAKRLGVAVVGGHTEVTPGLDRPIVVGTMLGEAEKLVRPDGAKPEDAIIMTKWAGLEGTAIIASEREDELKEIFGEALVERAKSLLEYLSVVPEAMLLRNFADAMHDPTEGGILNGLHEMADASGLGLRIFADRIPVREETERICSFYGINPLALISSGSLLAAVPRDNARFVVERLLARGINAAIIGEFLAEKKRIMIKGGDELPLPRPVSDELWKVV
ncbi:AIR synthase family protein [Thermococcus sp. AM4]|uniref:AIR synthase family protein n=1 Tax=Thermococcus sp. (strain AM4) TaxID=246969 RepID=UPI0001870F7D|nr:AIR synthase family protein [Thermococcus sp. AM4]EEB73182.1 Thiamine-monophosphate kinase [Thermococcus sp. AM4]